MDTCLKDVFTGIAYKMKYKKYPKSLLSEEWVIITDISITLNDHKMIFNEL